VIFFSCFYMKPINLSYYTRCSLLLSEDTSGLNKGHQISLIVQTFQISFNVLAPAGEVVAWGHRIRKSPGGWLMSGDLTGMWLLGVVIIIPSLRFKSAAYASVFLRCVRERLITVRDDFAEDTAINFDREGFLWGHKVKFLHKLKSPFGAILWSFQIDTSYPILPLALHLHRMGLVESPTSTECGKGDESRDHFRTECDAYTLLRYQ